MMTFKNLTDSYTFSVLLADDNLETRNIFEIVLDHYALPLYTVGTAAAMLDYLKDHSPDVIVIDLVLPDQDGYQLFRQVRQRVSSKIIATTAYHTFDTEQKVLTWGFDGFLPKPLSTTTLVAYLTKIANGRQ
jgi:DNA-binding response OmpR family regulator